MGSGMEMARRRPVVVLLVAMACGPTILPERDTDDGTAGSGTTSTGPQDPSATTTSGPPSDTTSIDEGTTGSDDPSAPCPPAVRGQRYLWCGAVSLRCLPATDGSWVYFGTEGGGIWRVNATALDIEGLAPAASVAEGLGDVFDLEVVDGRVYWTAFFDGVVGSVDTSGGPLQILADDLFKPSSIAVGGGYAFVTQYGDDLPVMRYDLASGEGTALYPDHDHAGRAFVHEGALYFATGTNGAIFPNPLYRGSFDGAPLQWVMDAEGSFTAIVPEGSTLWWARYRPDDSAIHRTELVEPVATTTLYAFPEHPSSLVLHTDRIVWTDTDIRTGDRLRSVTRDGGDPLVHATGDAIRGVVNTHGGLVFLTADAVVRLE